jgi:hypothetical protein
MRRPVRQLVDVEETAIVDFLRRHPPVGEPVRLLVEKRVEGVETPRVAGGAVEMAQARLDQPGHVGARARERGQAPFDDFLLAGPGRRLLRIACAPRGEVAARGQDAEQLVAVSSRVFRQPCVQMDAQDGRKRIGCNRDEVVEVADDEGTLLVGEA